MLRNWLSGVQVIEQRLGVESIEAFGGRAVRELAAAFAPEPRHAHRGAEFPEWLAERGNGKRAVEMLQLSPHPARTTVAQFRRPCDGS